MPGYLGLGLAYMPPGRPRLTTRPKARHTDTDTGTNGQVEYSIAQVADTLHSTGRFSIDADTGEVKVTKSLNYEATHRHVLIIKASDKVHIIYKTTWLPKISCIFKFEKKTA